MLSEKLIKRKSELELFFSTNQDYIGLDMCGAHDVCGFPPTHKGACVWDAPKSSKYYCRTPTKIYGS